MEGPALVGWDHNHILFRATGSTEGPLAICAQTLIGSPPLVAPGFSRGRDCFPIWQLAPHPMLN